MSDLNKENIIPPYFYFNTKYAEWFEDLNNEQAGQAIKSICSYVTLKELPKLEDPAAKIVVTAMKQDIDKSFKKYRARCENGKKGGAPKGNKNAAKKTDVKGSFLSLPIDEVGNEVGYAYEIILFEANKTNFDIHLAFKPAQLAELVAIYAANTNYSIDSFDDFCIKEYDSLKSFVLNLGATKTLKELKEIMLEDYEGETPFETVFADKKQRAVQMLALPEKERIKYYNACRCFDDPEELEHLECETDEEKFTDEELKQLKLIIENKPKTS